MDFGHIEVTARQREFTDELEEFIRDHVTDEVRRQEREQGLALNVAAHEAMGARGWVLAEWPREQGGAALDPVERRILEHALHAAEYPWVTPDMTKKVWGSAQKLLAPEVAAELADDVAAGRRRFCLGYTEPQGGSDIAGARLTAVRDGAEWVLSGAKAAITGVADSSHVFLLTRTDPDAPKHAGMTMFLVPLDLPGIEVIPVETLGGERIFDVVFHDVRVEDRWRLGEPGSGWAVLRTPLDEEHGVGVDTRGLHDPSVGRIYVHPLERALAAAIAWFDSDDCDRPGALADSFVLRRLGEVAVAIETAVSAPGPGGRVVGADAAKAGIVALLEAVGPQGLIEEGQPGVIGRGEIAQAHRFAQGTGLYGGTPEIFRGMVAQQLGLPRPILPGHKAFLP